MPNKQLQIDDQVQVIVEEHGLEMVVRALIRICASREAAYARTAEFITESEVWHKLYVNRLKCLKEFK
jgi:hypothetical protein